MKQYIIIGAVLATLALTGYTISQIKGCKAEDTKKAAIENPEVKEAEVIHETIVEVVTPEGETVTTTERTIGRVRETKVPEIKTERNNWAFSGGYGISFEGQESYYAGIGYRLTDDLWTEVVYHSVGENQAVTLGLRYEF